MCLGVSSTFIISCNTQIKNKLSKLTKYIFKNIQESPWQGLVLVCDNDEDKILVASRRISNKTIFFMKSKSFINLILRFYLQYVHLCVCRNSWFFYWSLRCKSRRINNAQPIPSIFNANLIVWVPFIFIK